MIDDTVPTTQYRFRRRDGQRRRMAFARCAPVQR
jgi:hypothetical protein